VFSLLAVLAGALGLVVGTATSTSTAAPAGASGPHAEWAPGVRIPSDGRAQPWPSTTGDVRRGSHLTDVHVVLQDVRHSCVKDLDVMLDHGSRRTLLLSDVGDQGVTPFSCHDIYVPRLTIDDDCPAFPNPIPEAARKAPGMDICARPTDNDATGHNEDCFDTFGCYAADAEPLWSTFHDRSPSSRWDLYVVDDAGGDAGSIGSWEVDITTTDQPPTSGTTTVDAYKGQDLAITLPGSDPDDGAVACEVWAAPTKGSLDGLYDPGCTKTYRAGARATGQDQIGYVTEDTASHTSPYGQVTITIVNRPPVASTVNVTARAGERIPLALGGTDPDPSETATCIHVAQPRLGTIEGSGCARTYVAGPAGGVDTFSYTVADDFGAQANGTVTVGVAATTPTATPQEVTATKGTPLAIQLGGTDPQGRPLTCEVVASDIGSFGDLSGTGCTRTFTPKPNTSGRVTFAYVVENDTGQTSAPATVGIRVANRVPVATNVSRTINVGETITLPLGGTDPDPGEPVSCGSVGPALLGTLERVAGDGTGCGYRYTAGRNVGNDLFTYDVTDVLGGLAKGNVEIRIVDPRPTADAKAVTAGKGTPVTIALTGTSPMGDGPVTCQAPTATAQGKGTLAGTGCTRTFTASPRTSGTDAFTYTVKDAKGRTSAAATVTITIANRAPVAPTVAITVPVGDSAAVALGGTDPDPGEGLALTCTPVTGPTPRGRVSGTGCFVTYTAGAAAGTDSFAYTVRDPAGATATGRVDVTIQGTAPAGCTAGEPQDARYVCRTYTDLLGRTASAADKAYWLGRLRSGENRAAIVKAFTGTPEYRTSVVRGIWLAYLGTRPDAATEQRWVAELGRGANPDLVRQDALASAAFLARAGGTPEGFVEGLFQQVLRRPATASEISSLAGQLRSGTTRTVLVGRLLATREADTPTVATVYERFLRRSPGGETSYWVDRLQGGESELALVRLIIASAEYHDRA
jgi:hypothetical protein